MTQQPRSRFSSTVMYSGDVSRSRGSWSPLDTSPLPTLLGVDLTADGCGAGEVSDMRRDCTRWRFKSSKVVPPPPRVSTAAPSSCPDSPDKSDAASFRSPRPDFSVAGVAGWSFSDFEGTPLRVTFGSVDRRALRSGLTGCSATSLMLSPAGGVTFT